MNQLPNEILTLIFNCSDFETLIKVFKRVCRKWSKLIDELVKYRFIIVNEEKHEPFVLKLFHTDQIADYENGLVIHSVKYIKMPSLEIIWKNIRKLIIYNCELNFNIFEQVEHLETHFSKVMNLKKISKLVTINLNKLKILNLSLEFSIHTHYILNTPELHSLKTMDIEDVELYYPLTLKNLECNVYKNCIKKFRNLKILICNRIDLYDGKLLKNLLKLKQFQVNCIEKGEINALLKEKEELNLINLQIILKGIIIKNISNQFPAALLNNDLENFSSSNYQIFIENSENLTSNFYFIKDFFIDFNIDDLPAIFYLKLNYLKSIIVHQQLENEISWTALLKSSRTVHTIKIFYPIYQYYCELIPNHCAYLNTLITQKANIKNFEFVSKFRNLERFTTDQEIAIDEFRMLIDIIDHNKFLKFITFKFKKIDFKVEVIEKYVYCEYYKCVIIKKFDQLVDILNVIESWADIILLMKPISSFKKDEFKGKLFRLCYKFQNFGNTTPLDQIINTI